MMPMVRPENMPWKADSWGNPTGWAER